MAGEREEISISNEIHASATPTPVKVIQDAPVFYVDGVWNQIRGLGIAKFHFFRTDANLTGGGYVKNEVLQVVMPAQAFADMVAFFEHRLKLMVKHGNLTQDSVDERRAFYATYPDE